MIIQPITYLSGLLKQLTYSISKPTQIIRRLGYLVSVFLLSVTLVSCGSISNLVNLRNNLIKFPTKSEHFEVCAIEYIYAACAFQCGLDVPQVV